MHYDLPLVAPEEGPMIDPLSHKLTLPRAAAALVEDGYQWTQHMVHQAYQSPTGHDADASVSRIRSLLGHMRTDTAVERQWVDHLKQVAGEEATNPQEWDLLSRSIEAGGRDSEVAYQSLSVPMKYVRDSIRLVAAAAGMAGEELGMLQRTHGYVPRVGLMIKEGKGFRGARQRQLLTTEPRVHRTLAARSVDLLTESRIQVEQAYKTTKDAADAVLRQREYVTGAILNRTPWYDVIKETGAGVPLTDYKEIEQIQAIIESDPEAARAHAAEYAAKLLPEMSLNIFDALPKLGKQIRAITSQRAMEDLMNSVTKSGKAAAVRTPQNSREVAKLASEGYVSMRIPGFSRMMVDGEYGKLLERMSQLSAKKPPGWLAKPHEVEGIAVTKCLVSLC